VSQPAYIVFAHGSSVESANEAVRVVGTQAAQRGEWRAFDTAFLEGGKPDLPTAIGNLIARGESQFVIVPYFLTTGLHLKRDLPNLIKEIHSLHPTIEIEVTEPLDGHPAMVDALVDRAKQFQCKPAQCKRV
jgi:sirohydrochlorin ferrochelatase